MSDTSNTNRNLFSAAELGVLGFTCLHMATWLVSSFLLKNDEFVFYFIVMCLEPERSSRFLANARR